MRRRILLFLLVLCPLQLVWTAVSAYCLHESLHETGASQDRHVGHHFHAHQGADESNLAGTLTADADCAACHAGGAGAPPLAADARVVIAFSAVAANRPSPAFTSALARAPDRPQWRRLV